MPNINELTLYFQVPNHIQSELSLAALDLARASSAASFPLALALAPLDFHKSSASASAARFATSAVSAASALLDPTSCDHYTPTRQ